MSKCCELKILGLQAVLACASCLLFAFSQSKLTSIHCVLAAKKHHSDEAEPLKNTGTETFKVSKHNTAKVLFAFLFCNEVTSRAAETSSRKIVAPVTSCSESSLLSFKQLTFAKDQERWWGQKMWKCKFLFVWGNEETSNEFDIQIQLSVKQVWPVWV